ncbi:hypothetical protein L1887_03525 [Cichorium endivia]|nr:hypothetical protein L1887_03525 [Cichorium endivia]
MRSRNNTNEELAFEHMIPLCFCDKISKKREHWKPNNHARRFYNSVALMEDRTGNGNPTSHGSNGNDSGAKARGIEAQE